MELIPQHKLKEINAQLDQLGQELFQDGAFFASMSDEDKEKFGKAISLLAQKAAVDLFNNVEISVNSSIHTSAQFYQNYQDYPKDDRTMSTSSNYHEEQWRCDGCKNEVCTCEQKVTESVEPPMDEGVYIEPVEWRSPADTPYCPEPACKDGCTCNHGDIDGAGV